VLIQQDDIDRLAVELPGARQAAEAGAHDHDPGTPATVTLPSLVREFPFSHR